jgi:uncharacterized membrane protein YeaQ/YmgE (transglycosylase-associated protein family)
MNLIVWIAVGLLAGAVAWSVPRRDGRRRGGCAAFFLGVLGALAGGALATALGFGGPLGGVEPRAAVIAALAAVLLLELARLVSDRRS